jgi:two-component system, NarL family, invasion response regulator UvrY
LFGRSVSASFDVRGRTVDVLTVDDSPGFLEAARELIAATPGFRAVGEARSGEEALASADVLRPDLVLLDVRMPAMDGIETARLLAVRAPRAVVVLITAEDPTDVPRGAHRCGAAALVRKQDLAPSMLHKLWAGAGGRA